MIITGNLISVHGREGLLLPYARFTLVNNIETQVDISANHVFFEVSTAHLRVPLVVNPADPLGLLILLERSDVEKLQTTPSPFIVVDESGEIPVVEWDGTIRRTGYKGDPSAI